VEQPPKDPIENTPNNEKEKQTAQSFSSKIPNIETDKSPLPFNLGAKVPKLKISVHLTELVNHEM